MEIRPKGLMEYLEILWHRRRLIFLVSVVMLIATFVIIRRIPFLYESRALIGVTNLEQIGEGMPIPAVKFTSVVQHLKSRSNLGRMVNELKPYPMIANPEFSRGILGKEIKVDVKNRDIIPDGPESVSVAFRHTDREMAKKVVEDLAAVFEQANAEIRQHALDEIRRISIEVSEVESRLRQIGSERDLAALRNQLATRQATEAMAARTQKVAVDSAIEALSDQQVLLDNQILETKKQISDQERIIADAATRGSAGNAAFGALLVRKADLDAQLKVYQTQYTEKNPKIIAVREQISEINRQMERMASGATENGVALNAPEMVEMRRLRQELSRLETQKEVNRRDLERKNIAAGRLNVEADGGLPPMAPDTVALANRAEYDRLAIRFSRLIDQQERLKRTAGVSGNDAPLFRIIDPASLPLMPVAPNLLMLVGLALGLALGIALLAVIIVELPKLFILNDERDIDFYLGAPVLAMIPETRSQLEQARTRRIRLVRGVFVLLLMIVSIPAVVFILDSTKIFQILGSR